MPIYILWSSYKSLKQKRRETEAGHNIVHIAKLQIPTNQPLAYILFLIELQGLNTPVNL